MDADLYSLRSEVRRLEQQVESLTRFRDDLHKEKREKYQRSWHRGELLMAALLGFMWGMIIAAVIVRIKYG